MNICDYTTIDAVRSDYLKSDATTRDDLLLDIIRAVSREIEHAANRKFYPRIETRTFDVPQRQWANRYYDQYYAGVNYPSPDLLLDDDCLSVTSVTNGDGSAVTAYKLYPLNASVKSRLRLLASAAQPWLADSSGDTEGAISVAGVWGHHEDYASAWQDTGATLAAQIATTTAATFTCTTGKLVAGNLVKIDSEYLYVSAVATSTSDTVTATRGVNGSTAAAHTTSAEIDRWTMSDIEMVARQAAAALFRLRTNPVGDTVTVDGQTFATPKDVSAWIRDQLNEGGHVRTGIG